MYRLKNKSEIYNLDIELALRDCTIIEWPEIIEDILPNDRINIYFVEINTTKIEISVRSNKNKIMKNEIIHSIENILKMKRVSFEDIKF